jgi:DNA-binding Lrp family transcriptional regulator
MNRLTGRYKNEAARREFFTNLAAVTEAIHINASDDRIKQLFERRDSDKLVDMVLRETAALVRSSFDPSDEIRQRLATVRREFSECMSSAEGLFGLKWEDSEKYDPDLSLVSFFDPWHSENEQTEKWGTVCYYNPTVLNVNPPVMFFDALRRSVIAREAVNFLTPRIVDSVHRLYEQSEYLVTKLLRDKYEKEFWLFARHGLREETKKDIITGITDFFGYYESFVGDDLYREAWSRLEEMTRLSLQIGSVPEYARMLDTIAARPVRVRLDRNEIALFNVLAERPDMPTSEVARRINTSIPTAAKLMQRLAQKACLRFFIHVNDRTLGLEEYLLLMKTSRPDRLPSVLWRIPYCRDIYRMYGPMDYFVVVNVPEENESFIRRLESELKNCDLASQLTTLVSTRDFSNMSFVYFDSDESVWHVHWDSWGAGLAKAMKERKSIGQLRFSGYGTQKVSVDRLDLQIMEKLMYNSRGSYSEIGKALGVSGAYVSRKIHRLLRNQVFRPIAKPFKIGAEEYALVTAACEEEYVGPLIEFLGRLPAWRGAAVKGSYEGVLAQVGVPSGEVNQLFMVLDDRLVKTHIAQCSFNVVGMWSSLRRWLPINLFSKHEGWKFEENKYLDIIERYGK